MRYKLKGGICLTICQFGAGTDGGNEAIRTKKYKGGAGVYKVQLAGSLKNTSIVSEGRLSEF